MKTRKKPLSTSVDLAIYERIELLAKVDNRSIAEVVAMCAKAGLPLVESDIMQRVKVTIEPGPNGDNLMRVGDFKPFSMTEAARRFSQPPAVYPPHHDETALAEDRPAKVKRAA